MGHRSLRSFVDGHLALPASQATELCGLRLLRDDIEGIFSKCESSFNDTCERVLFYLCI